MVYEGDVKVISDDGKTFTFDSPEGVAWLQMYVDMVKAGTVDNDRPDHRRRPRRPRCSSRPARRRSTRPARTSSAKSRPTTQACTATWPSVPPRVGKSGVAGQGPDGASPSRRTPSSRTPSIALAQFFTNPRSMVEFAKQVADLPVDPRPRTTIRSSRRRPTPIEDSARPIAKDIISQVRRHRPDHPQEGRRQRRSSSRRSSRRCSTASPRSRRSTDAVADGQRADPVAQPLARSPGPPRLGHRLARPRASRRTGRHHRTDHDQQGSRPRPTCSSRRRSCCSAIFVAVPDRRGRLLQLHRLRHRPPPVWIGLENYRAAARRPDVLAGARRTRSSTCS